MMLRDRLDSAPVDETMPSGTLYPIVGPARGDSVVAVRGAQAISRTRFLRDVAALAVRLPDHRYILNLCTDRYRFMVGFAAALCRGQVSLLPPSDAPGMLKGLAEDYPDLYALTDGARAPFASLSYPESLEDGPRHTDGLAVPGAQAALILFTSGSTGRPTPIPKSWGALARSALAAGERLGAERLRGATVIGTVPHQHSYGLESTILLGLQNGMVIDATPRFYPSDIRAAIEAVDGESLLVTTPVHLQALVAEPGGMPQARLILSATAPLSAALAAQAEACFRAPLIEIYGCTEAGQLATRRTVESEGWHCLDGVVLDQRDGRSWASGGAVEGEVALHDVIEQTGDGRFLLRGRSADLVDVAGKRTSLAHLNHQLLGLPGVTDGVFLMGDPDGRAVARLAAVVVAPALRPEDILRALRERIDAAFLPRPLVMVEALPRNALGKLPRETLLALVRRGRDAG